MTRKPNFWKCIVGATVVALLFVGTWASTRAPKASAASGKSTSKIENNVATAVAGAKLNNATTAQPNPSCLTPAWDEVFEIDQNAASLPAHGDEQGRVARLTVQQARPEGGLHGRYGYPAPRMLAR